MSSNSRGPVTAAPPPPDTPAAPTIGTADSSGLTLNWQKPSETTSFKLHIGSSTSFTDPAPLTVTVAAAGCDSGTDCSYVVPHSQLATGADNYFRIVATGSGGDSTASMVSTAWASPPVLTAPTSELAASFVAGSTTGSWQAPTVTSGLGTKGYAFTTVPAWLTANNATRTLTVSGTVPAVGAMVPNITYTITDNGGRDSQVTAQIVVQITAAGPLTLSQPECTTSQTHATGATVGECGLGSAGGGSGGAKTYTLTKTGGNAADLAALGLEVVAGGSALTSSGDPLAYTSTAAMNIRSIDGETAKEGSIRLRYRVTESSSGASAAEYTFTISVGETPLPPPPPATAPAADSGGSSSGGIVALAIIGAGAYYYWKKRQVANGNAAKMALLPDVSFDLDRNDRRAFYTRMNWQNPGNSNWQIRSNLQMHTKYDGKLLDWHANSHIGYRLNGKFGDFNPYLRGKFVQNAPENAEMQKTYSFGLNYAIPNRFSVQIVQPDSELARFSVKTRWYLPRGIGLQLNQPNSDLKNYGFGVQWRGKSKIRYGLHGETGGNSYRFTGEFGF